MCPFSPQLWNACQLLPCSFISHTWTFTWDSEIETEKELSILNQKCSEEVKTPELVSQKFPRANSHTPESQEACNHKGQEEENQGSSPQSLKRAASEDSPVCRKERPENPQTPAFDRHLSPSPSVVTIQRSKTGQRVFTCDICNKTFKYNSETQKWVVIE